MPPSRNKPVTPAALFSPLPQVCKTSGHAELGKAPEETRGHGEGGGVGEELRAIPRTFPGSGGDTSRFLPLLRAAETTQLMRGCGED